MKFQTQYVDVDGIATHYVTAGNGPPLILVHGGNYGGVNNSEDWRPNIAGLAKHFTIYALDKVGMGFTGNPPSPERYTMTETVEHLGGFLDALQLTDVHLLGHSRGAYAVTRLALERPHFARTLVVVSTGSLVKPTNPIYEKWSQEVEKLNSWRDRTRYLMSVNSYSDGHITDDYLDLSEQIMALDKTQEALAVLASGAEEAYKAGFAPQLKEAQTWIRDGRLNPPVLLIWGYDDPSATITSRGVQAMDLVLSSPVDGQMHIVNRAGHYCFRERPEEFNSVVTQFVSLHR